MIDFHSHFLPKIDDGSQSRETSLEMLEASVAYGVDTMVATPHFYVSSNSANNFVKQRAEAFEAVVRKAEHKNIRIPQIILGAEVYFFRGISHYEEIEKLCIENTELMLLEMPFERWNDRIIEEVSAIKDDVGITPVIAHIERYIPFQKGTDYIEKLISLGFPIQMNAEYVNAFLTRGKAINMIIDGIVGVLGSDCHNMDKRRPNLGTCMHYIEKKCGAGAVEAINDYSRKLLGLD